MKMLRFVGYWVLPTLLGLLFVVIGLAKFGTPVWEENFARWGYPNGAFAVVGGLELVGGLALLVPRLTAWSAGGLILIMIGAFGTHLAFGETRELIGPTLYATLLALAAYSRLDSRLGARRRSSATPLA